MRQAPALIGGLQAPGTRLCASTEAPEADRWGFEGHRGRSAPQVFVDPREKKMGADTVVSVPSRELVADPSLAPTSYNLELITGSSFLNRPLHGPEATLSGRAN